MIDPLLLSFQGGEQLFHYLGVQNPTGMKGNDDSSAAFHVDAMASL
jgi:hypothetical protein